MSPNTRPASILRFGAFELELRAGELRKKGLRIRLQEQPFQVLHILLQHRGEIVTREQLRSAVWPADTFVDFDNGLNTAVNKLREALGDSADSPRFIETLPRRGYRFIAPVTSDGQQPAVTERPAIAPSQNWKAAAFVSLLVIVGLVTTAVILRWHTPRLTGKDFVVLGDFANSTGDGIFDGTLRQGLSVQLEQSPFMKLESQEQIHQTLRMMGQKLNVPLTPEITREVCQRTNGAAALNGSIALVGSRYDLILRAVDCASGDLLASAEVQANDKTDVLDALGGVASKMRRKLGESLGTVQKYDTPLVQATTGSLEALQLYTLGDQTLTQTGNFTASLAFFQRATEIDPNFAMAYFAMSDAYSTIGETASSRRYMQQAFELREKVSERERLDIEGMYYYYVPGDLVKAQRSFDLLGKLYPDSIYAHIDSASISNMLGQYEAGLREYRKALNLYPFNSPSYRHVAFTYLLLNRVEDAAAVAKEAHAKGLDSNLAPILYAIAFYQSDPTEMVRQVSASTGKPGEEDLLCGLEGDTAAYFGHLEKARELSLRAADSAERAEEKETAATYYAVSALREALFGDAYKARQLAKIAKRHSHGRDMDYGVALALAYAGDTNRAQALTDDLGKRFPEDTIAQLIYLPTLRARLAVSRSNPQQAIDILQAAAPYELGLPGFGFYNWPNLYPVYVRGEAYLAMHREREAVAEFQKIVDHRGIVLNEPIGALAHLQIGRAYARQNDPPKAKAAYQDFLELWKDADPDIPILKEAKAEYAKLQ